MWNLFSQKHKVDGWLRTTSSINHLFLFCLPFLNSWTFLVTGWMQQLLYSRFRCWVTCFILFPYLSSYYLSNRWPVSLHCRYRQLLILGLFKFVAQTWLWSIDFKHMFSQCKLWVSHKLNKDLYEVLLNFSDHQNLNYCTYLFVVEICNYYMQVIIFVFCIGYNVQHPTTTSIAIRKGVSESVSVCDWLTCRWGSSR